MTLHPQDVHRLRAHVAGWLSAEPWPHVGDELVAGLRRLSGEPAPVPAAQPVPRRQRKRSLAKVCEAARKAGAHRVVVDGVVIELSPAAAVPEPNGNDLDQWLAKGRAS